MTDLNIAELFADACPAPFDVLNRAERQLRDMPAGQRIVWMRERFPGRHVLICRFQPHAEVLLHLAAQGGSRIRVVHLDTGARSPEVYRYIDALWERLDLDLRVFRLPTGSSDASALLRRIAMDMGVGTWISDYCADEHALPILQSVEGRFRLNPLIDWSTRDLQDYAARHRLPRHPLEAPPHGQLAGHADAHRSAAFERSSRC